MIDYQATNIINAALNLDLRSAAGLEKFIKVVQFMLEVAAQQTGKRINMANDELNQLIKVAREAAFFIRSIDGYENSKIANELSSLAEKVESQKLLAIANHGRS